MSALIDTPATRWDMVKNNQLQLCLTNKEHALNFDPFSNWTFISLMNYNFLISYTLLNALTWYLKSGVSYALGDLCPLPSRMNAKGKCKEHFFALH